MGQWSDLPRRLATVSIGAPLIILVLSNRITSHIFFQGVHLLCVLEWLKLAPAEAKCTAMPLKTKKSDETENDSLPAQKVSSFSFTSAKIFPIASFLAIYVPNQFHTAYVSIVAATLYLSTFIDNELDPISTSLPNIQQNTCQHSLHGLLYLTLSFRHWIQLSSQSFSHTIYLLFIVWNCDTGALLAGRIGKMVFSSQDILGDLIMNFESGKKLVKIVKRVSPSKA